MALPPLVRSLLPLLVGLTVGVVGATMFLQSMPGAEGSQEERANKLQVELQRAQNRIVALEAANEAARKQPGFFERKWGAITGRDGEADGSSFSHNARRIAEDLRDGRPVSPEDIFRATQPVLRDLAPLFDRMRLKQQQQSIDSMTGELARKYNLSPQGQESLKQWFGQRADTEAKRWKDLIARDTTTLEDMTRAARDLRVDDGLDAFMPTLLPAEQAAAFSRERMAERAQRVEQEADMKVTRLNSIVALDESQREQVFGIMARGSRDYDPSMRLEGSAGQIAPTPGGDADAAMMSVLRPDQRAAYQAERERRRALAAKEADAFGLKLPANWDMFDGQFP